MADAASLPATRWRWCDSRFTLRDDGRWWRPRRGWLRRIAPPDWCDRLHLGTREAAEVSAQLALLTALADAEGLGWLTSYWAMARAENKLVQCRCAANLGIPVPMTATASNSSDIPIRLGASFVVKTLGVGHYEHEGRPYAVHAAVLARQDSALRGLSLAPFLVQQTIDAAAHLRVVTVGNQAWTCRLDAAGLPLDWREHDGAHHSWIADQQPAVEGDAIRLAAALQLGYSSQDWILDGTGSAWMIDVNPAGQWLFLPEQVGCLVTAAIAEWLLG